MKQLGLRGAAAIALYRWLGRLLGVLIGLLLSATAIAAPEAHILRVDPRASLSDGAPILTTVVELVQHKRMSDITGACAQLTGDAELDCISDRLEQKRALYSPFKFPQENAFFTVTVDGVDQPATHVSTERWGANKDKPGVGTAWLILVDASSTMGPRFNDAKFVAKSFIGMMGPHDIVDVMFFNDRSVVQDSKWLAKKGLAGNFVDGVRSTFPAQGRTKSLFSIIKQATVDGFAALGNVGNDVDVPMHQAMVVLSDGSSSLDPGSAAPTALGLRDFLTKGRFPEENTTLPKTPLPVLSVWFPRKQTEELFQNSRQFMENLANTEIGGAFFIVRAGQAGKGTRIAQAVVQRFDEMHIVKWRVACVAPTVSQTYKLVFKSTNPPIAGDNCINCPTAIDPTTWPLDVDVEQTEAWAKKNRVYPGGTLRVFGNFCWGSDHDRAELYMLPKNQPPPESLEGRSLEEAKQFQRTLIEAGLRGKSVSSDATFAEFEVPDSTKFLTGTGKNLSARVILFDAAAKRSSAITADKILTLPAEKKPLNLLLIGGGVFGGVVVLLLVVGLFRGGSRRSRRSSRVAPAPPVPGPSPGPAPVGAAPGYAPAAAAGPAPMAPQAGPAPVGMGAGAHFPDPAMQAGPPMGGPMAPGPVAPGPMAPAALAPGPMAPAPFPGGPLPGGPRSVALHGAPGIYPLAEGREIKVGRDPGLCDICLTEPRVSGQHATLRFETGQLSVRDDGSNNGTYINGGKIPSHAWQPLAEGTVLRFGPVEFTVRFE